MATQTPNYSFQKPTVSGDSGVWGGYLNDNFTSLDNLLGGNTAITGIDINSGSIDGTAIGANAASTGAFSTLSASGTITFGGVALTATGTEINYLDGVTSNIQTQLDAGGTGDVTLTGTQTLTNKTLTSVVLGGTTSTASGNLVVDPATQIVEVKGDGSSVEGQIKLNCHVNSHGQTLKAQPHSASATNTMLLPQGANSTLVSKVSVDTLTNKTLQGYAEITNALGNATGAKTIDLALGNSVTATTTGGTTWTFSGAAAADELSAFSIKLVNGGSATQTWPTSVDWPAATAPTLTTSGTDVLVFITCDGGTTWYGFVAGLALA
jgi:hypothetical protein